MRNDVHVFSARKNEDGEDYCAKLSVSVIKSVHGD